ncbi:MAG TPA: sulfatase-like hydrolase/transferase, partial [Vicinamibacteria bacterium]|nr:sulfatase-like hydrolase/transferase [Vicinamibacteria bacterium]
MTPKWTWPFAAALVAVGSFPGCAARPLPEARSRKPNVLLLALDEVALRLGSTEPGVRTPHLDRLAGRGRRFDHAYRQYPIRVPARVSLLLGRRPETTRIWGDLESGDPWPGSVALPDPFRSQGYFTARVGRFLGSPGDEALHFDVAEEASPDEAAARTARLMEEKKDGPFFVIVGFNRPRPGWIPPSKYFELYNAQQLPLPPEPTVDWDGIPPLALADAGVAAPSRASPPPLPEEPRRRALAAELAYLSYLDAQAGVLLEALDRLKLRESTVVAVVGD